MRPYLVLSILALSSAVMGAPAPAQTGGTVGSPAAFYLSPSGNDSWSGTLPQPAADGSDGPFRTFEHAQQALRSSTTAKTVELRGGAYMMNAPLTFGRADSGEAWVAYGNERPVIDGGGTAYITFRQTLRFTLEGLTFKHLGLNPAPYPSQIAAFVGDKFVVRWNTFVGCINFCFFGVRLTNSIIDSNTVEGQSPGNPAGNRGYGYYALEISNGSSDDRISHNLIENTEGGGIAVGSGATDWPNNNVVIDLNLLRNVDTNVYDAGALYVLDRTHSATGIKLTNNLISNSGGPNFLNSWTQSIYLDDLTSNVLVEGNVCSGPCGEQAVHIHGGDHNTIRYNIFDLSKGSMLGIYDDVKWPPGVKGGPADGGFAPPWMSGNVVESNIIYAAASLHVPLWQHAFHDPHMTGPRFSGNLIYGRNVKSANAGPFVDTSPIYDDPMFTDPDKGEYAIPANSPARRTLGFPVLPTDQGPLPRPARLPANP